MEVYGVSVHGAPRDTEKMINEQKAMEEKILALKLKVYYNGQAR